VDGSARLRSDRDVLRHGARPRRGPRRRREPRVRGIWRVLRRAHGESGSRGPPTLAEYSATGPRAPRRGAQVGETAVMVAVVTAHREEAFSAARFCIDEVKATVPIWKFETWATAAPGGCRARWTAPPTSATVRCNVATRACVRRDRPRRRPSHCPRRLLSARRGPVPLASALGCVTASPVVADAPVPAFANSSMDGFALVAADTLEAPVVLNVVATTLAGMAPASLGGGEAVRIMTGAPLPSGADAVCMIERTMPGPGAGESPSSRWSDGGVRPAPGRRPRRRPGCRGRRHPPRTCTSRGARRHRVERVEVIRRPG